MFSRYVGVSGTRSEITKTSQSFSRSRCTRHVLKSLLQDAESIDLHRTRVRRYGRRFSTFIPRCYGDVLSFDIVASGLQCNSHLSYPSGSSLYHNGRNAITGKGQFASICKKHFRTQVDCKDKDEWEGKSFSTPLEPVAPPSVKPAPATNLTAVEKRGLGENPASAGSPPPPSIDGPPPPSIDGPPPPSIDGPPPPSIDGPPPPSIDGPPPPSIDGPPPPSIDGPPPQSIDGPPPPSIDGSPPPSIDSPLSKSVPSIEAAGNVPDETIPSCSDPGLLPFHDLQCIQRPRRRRIFFSPVDTDSTALTVPQTQPRFSFPAARRATRQILASIPGGALLVMQQHQTLARLIAQQLAGAFPQKQPVVAGRGRKSTRRRLNARRAKLAKKDPLLEKIIETDSAFDPVSSPDSSPQKGGVGAPTSTTEKDKDRPRRRGAIGATLSKETVAAPEGVPVTSKSEDGLLNTETSMGAAMEPMLEDLLQPEQLREMSNSDILSPTAGVENAMQSALETNAAKPPTSESRSPSTEKVIEKVLGAPPKLPPKPICVDFSTKKTNTPPDPIFGKSVVVSTAVQSKAGTGIDEQHASTTDTSELLRNYEALLQLLIGRRTSIERDSKRFIEEYQIRCGISRAQHAEALRRLGWSRGEYDRGRRNAAGRPPHPFFLRLQEIYDACLDRLHDAGTPLVTAGSLASLSSIMMPSMVALRILQLVAGILYFVYNLTRRPVLKSAAYWNIVFMCINAFMLRLALGGTGVVGNGKNPLVDAVAKAEAESPNTANPVFAPSAVTAERSREQPTK